MTDNQERSSTRGVPKWKSEHLTSFPTVDDFSFITDLCSRYGEDYDEDPKAKWEREDSEEESVQESDLSYIIQTNFIEV